MATTSEKPLSQAIVQRRATPSFDGRPGPNDHLRQILEAGLRAADTGLAQLLPLD